MRATRRRHRTPDTLAQTEAIRAVCEELRSRMPGVIPKSEKQLIRFLYAVRHVEPRPASDIKRSRLSRWKREDLVNAAGHLCVILERETLGRVSVNSFIGHTFRPFTFLQMSRTPSPPDELTCKKPPSSSGLQPSGSGCPPRAARERRAGLLLSHLAVQVSQTCSRTRARELLGEAVEPDISGDMGLVVYMVDELLKVDASDARHMFWEEMKRLSFAMREVEPRTWTTRRWGISPERWMRSRHPPED